MSLPASNKKEKHPIPDPVDWLRQNSGGKNGPSNAGSNTGGSHKGHSNPSTPGKFTTAGASGTTKSSGASQGWGGIPNRKEPQGQEKSARSAQGSGKKKSELSPNNTKKAGSMIKGKPPFGMPSRNSLVRRAHPNFSGNRNPPDSGAQPSRSGILSKFEGFTPSNE